MKPFFCWLVVVSLAQGCSEPLRAQDTLARKHIFATALAFHKGFIFVHSADVENTREARPWGIQATLLWQRTDEQSWNTCRCYPRQGLLLSYYDYTNAVLGHSAKAAYFLEPVFRLTSRISLLVRGSGGLAYLTNPYDRIRNPNNQSYSLPVSAYVALGTGVYAYLHPQYRLNIHFLYEHISNGGMKEPNKGINYPTMGLGLEYLIRPAEIPFRSKRSDTQSITHRTRWDIHGFATSRTIGVGTKERFFIGGLGVTVSKPLGRLHALTAGLESYWDLASREKMRQDSIYDRSAFRQGLMLGHEFLLGKFTFSQQLGVYLFNEIPYFDRIYHRWGLVYKWNANWGIGFNLKAHRQVANFIDFRLVRSFRRLP